MTTTFGTGALVSTDPVAVLTNIEDTALILNAIAPMAAVAGGWHPSLFSAAVDSTIGDLPTIAEFQLYTGNASDVNSVLYAAEHNQAQFITDLYANALGRAPSAADISYYEGVINTYGLGATITFIGTSAEAQTHAHTLGWLPA